MNETLDNVEVNDRQSFIRFLNLLHKDFIANPESWENKILPDFLEALSAYANEIQGFYDNAKQNISADKPDWATFADIISRAKIYE